MRKKKLVEKGCIIFMLCTIWLNLTAQQTLEQRIDAAALYTGSVFVDGHEWYVVKRTTSGGDKYALLVTKYSWSYCQRFDGASNNYSGSEIQAHLTDIYNNNLNELKSIAVAPTLGDHTSNTAVTDFTPTKAPATGSDIIFLLSHRDAVDWHNALTPSTTIFSLFRKVGNQWTRTRRDANRVYVVNSNEGAPLSTSYMFVYNTCSSTADSQYETVFGIWVKYSDPAIFIPDNQLYTKIENATLYSGTVIADGIDWFVIRREVNANGRKCALLVAKRPLRHEVPFSLISNPTNDYQNSNLRNVMTDMYINNLKQLKYFSFQAYLTDFFNQTIITDVPLNMAENATQDVLFALSRQDAINWQDKYNYLLTSNGVYSKRWWCRTGTPPDGNGEACGAIPQMLTSGNQIITTIHCLSYNDIDALPAIWVNYDPPVSPSSSNPTICINTAISPVTITTTGATGIGTATGLPNGVTAMWANDIITISGIPTESGLFGYSIPLTGGYDAINATGTITVHGKPAPPKLKKH